MPATKSGSVAFAIILRQRVALMISAMVTKQAEARYSPRMDQEASLTLSWKAGSCLSIPARRAGVVAAFRCSAVSARMRSAIAMWRAFTPEIKMAVAETKTTGVTAEAIT